MAKTERVKHKRDGDKMTLQTSPVRDMAAKINPLGLISRLRTRGKEVKVPTKLNSNSPYGDGKLKGKKPSASKKKSKSK